MQPSMLLPAALALFAMTAAAKQPRPFRAEASVVLVPTVVLDKKGAVVTDLKVDSFQVFEDGTQMPIEAFFPPNAQGAGVDGRFIVLVLDNLHTRTELGSRVQAIARRFADRMEPRDVLSVITVSAGRAATQMGPAEVRAAIARFRPAFGESIRSEADDVAQGLQMIRALTTQLSKVSHRRKVVVFIGAASMFSPKDESAFADRGPDLNPLWFEAIRSSGRDNVSVYVIDPAGLTGDVEDYSQSFANQTGGNAWVNTGNFDGAVERIWRESGSYYLIGYPAPNDSRLHKIEVKVAVPGVTIRSRRARG